MIKNLLIATHNKAKLGELMMGVKKLSQKGVKILSLNDLKITDDPEETGKTFEENAILKATFYGKLTGIPTIADDGGLMIPYLNNEPGVKSKRWLGREATDEELINHALLHLRGVIGVDRTAYLQTCLCYYDPSLVEKITRVEKIKGHIAEMPSSNPTHGYPYRALFIVDEYNKYYDELTGAQHHKINHRLIALRRIVEKIVKS